MRASLLKLNCKWLHRIRWKIALKTMLKVKNIVQTLLQGRKTHGEAAGEVEDGRLGDGLEDGVLEGGLQDGLLDEGGHRGEEQLREDDGPFDEDDQ